MEDKGRRAGGRSIPDKRIVPGALWNVGRLARQAGLSFLLIMTLSASTAMGISSLVRNRNSANDTFGIASARVELGATKAIEWYSRALYGLRGLFEASVSVDSDEFRSYVNDFFSEGLYPGIQAFSYVERVCGAEPGAATSTGSFAGMIRIGDCEAPAVSYDLSPGEHFVVKYGETSEGGSETIGRDVKEIEARWEAMRRSAESDSVIFTKSTEILSRGTPGPTGFVAFLPVYANGQARESVTERWDHLVGFVAMSFESQAFFSGVMGEIGVDPMMGVQIYDDLGGESELRFSLGATYGVTKPDQAPSDRSVLQKVITYSNFGRNWLFRSFAPAGFYLSETEKYEPYFWFVFGVLLTFTILAVYAAVSRAEAMSRKSAIEALKERRLLELLMDNLPIGVVISSSPAGEFAMINAAGRELLGREMDTSVDRENYADRFDLVREDGARYAPGDLPLAKTLKTGRPAYVRDAYVRRPDGSLRAMRITSAIVRGGNGTAFVIILGEDITREVALDKARQNFASMAAHQLKTPPVAVSWCAEMLADPEVGKLNRKQKEYVERIEGLAARMIETVDALLVISRVEIGTFRIEPKPMDVAAAVSAEVSGLAEAATREKVSLDFEVEGRALPKVTNDERLIRMIAHNLIENAIRYTHKGGEVRVSVKRDGSSVTFSVADNGIGIPKDQQSSVFSRFFRADNAVAMNSEGSGLGLAVVKTIADKIGCKVSFVSEEGKGTVFTVRIPVAGKATKGRKA